MKKIYMILTALIISCFGANAATVVATVNGNQITDTDVTARTELMAKQGNVSTTNRRTALQNIIDDYIKLDYAKNFNVNPTDKDADKELKNMNLGDISETMRSMARLAVRSDIAWGVIIARTIVPTLDISDSDIKTEKSDLARERGLPLELTIIRLTDIPSDVAAKLTKPKDCAGAMKMAERLGGYPQKITAVQYELSADMRERVADLPLLTWSKVANDSVVLVCSEKKTSEYKDLDEIMKQNVTYKKAYAIAENQLKQLRRKAVIIINDDRYKL